MPFILCIAISEVSFFELSSSLLLRISEFTFLLFLLKKLLFQSFGISLLYFNITPILNISIITYFYIYKQQQQNSFHQNQMSIQNTSSPANFYMNSSMNQTNNFEPQFKQASQYLTKSISGMIKKQLKTYRLQKKLQKEVQEYKKKKQKKQFINQLHKVQKFRNNQNENNRKKYEQFLKKNQQKQNRIQSLIHKKEQQIRTRAIYQNKKLYQVKKRHNQTIQQEINTRLSRIESFQKSNTKLRTANMSLSKISSRCSSSQNYRTIIKDRSESQEQFRITNYLKKMKNAESKILQRQLKNQGRKIKSIQTQVKKLTATRDAYHQNLKQKYEQNYNSKMGSFYSKIQQIQLQNSSYLMNKSMLRSKLRENVLKNKQMNESQLFNKTLTSYMKKTKESQKENFSSWNHKKLDLLRTQSNFITNSIKMQKQAIEEQNQNNMRLVYAKVQKLKMMNDNQKVSQKQKQQILSLINPHDSQYQQIVQFLSCSKEQFLKKQIQKEEQKLNKIKKTGRNNKLQKC